MVVFSQGLVSREEAACQIAREETAGCLPGSGSKGVGGHAYPVVWLPSPGAGLGGRETVTLVLRSFTFLLTERANLQRTGQKSTFFRGFLRNKLYCACPVTQKWVFMRDFAKFF